MSAEQQAAQPAAATTELANESGLLDSMLSTARVADPEKEQARQSFQRWLEEVKQRAKGIPKSLEREVKAWMAALDSQVSEQLNKVLHHPDVQKLEGTWRGLHHLVHQTNTGETVQLRVMHCSKRELFRDLDNAIEFDQSTMFKKIYEEEYGVLGGQPFGMIVGDYNFDRTAEDVNTLKKMAGVAACAHAPFVSAASPQLFRMDSFTELTAKRDLKKIFDHKLDPSYVPWNEFREMEDSRYVALTMPRVLGRLPYGPGFTTVEDFNFVEEVEGKDHNNYLWMNSAWAYATRITDAAFKYGWLARSRGVEGGGLVEDLPVHTFPTDEGGVAMKCPTELAITDRRENELSELGFLPLLHYKHTGRAVFMGAQSCNKPKKYFDPDANSSAELSAKFNYMLCVSRFAHYLKCIVRDRVGSFSTSRDLQEHLQNWIENYKCDPTIAGDEMKARAPLSEAQVEVKEVPGRPGWYEATARMKPHFQLEGVNISLRLVGRMPNKS